MIRFTTIAILLCGLLCSFPANAKLTPEQLKLLPPPAQKEVSFSRDVKPIFESSCIKCHGRGRDKGNFRIDSRETVLKGGDSGPAIIEGKSEQSLLVELVSGVDPDNVMPKKGSKLTKDQVSFVRAWIDQGAKWDAQISFAKQPARNLTPRRPDIKLKTGVNPIDSILEAYFKTNHIKPARPVSDSVFARRVYLDLIGLLPTPQELDAFAADKNPDKRSRLVQRLLADNQRYAEHWLTFWNDALRNDYRGTGYIDGGRKQITAWLFTALYRNKPYDKFVAELVNPTDASAGFSKGIVWRGVVNASQVPAMQAAQNVSQIFMGINLKCASCHDSFVNDWTLAESYSLANIFSDEPLEIFQCDKPTGRKAGVQFLHPELGTISATNKSGRLQQLAQIMTDKKNGRLSRTIVNRLWAKFFGRGLVEPVDDMEQAAWNQDLLDWLAEDLVAHNYDLKQTIALMLTSRAYQMPAVSVSPIGVSLSPTGGEGRGEGASYFFRGPLVRRLSAEQFRDALAMLTGVWYRSPAGEFDFSCLVTNMDQLRAELKGKWIWAEADAAQKAPAGTVYFRKRIHLDARPVEARAVVTCDNSYTLFVNTNKVTSGKDYGRPQLADLKSYLREGDNIIAIKAVNHLPDNTAPSEDKPAPASAANPAGLYFSARLRVNGQWITFGTDDSWKWSRQKTNGWELAAFSDDDWASAAELGNGNASPWNMQETLTSTLFAPTLHDVRAALVNADPLMVCLGRPSREQVITSRSSAATTLQALELTNGETLAKVLEQAGSKLLAAKPKSAQELITNLYRKGLGRTPSSTELKLAQDLVTEPLKKESVEDLVWSLAMLPEFQLIY